MTSRSYFGKMNSTLGSVVPLAMFTSFAMVSANTSMHGLFENQWKKCEMFDDKRTIDVLRICQKRKYVKLDKATKKCLYFESLPLHSTLVFAFVDICIDNCLVLDWPSEYCQYDSVERTFFIIV